MSIESRTANPRNRFSFFSSLRNSNDLQKCPERIEQTTNAAKCPVCNKVYRNFSEKELSLHVEECLTVSLLQDERKGPASPNPETKSEDDSFDMSSLKHGLSPDRSRFVTQKLEHDLDQDLECTICYENYTKDQLVARLECLCLFHKDCIDGWFAYSNFCPLHPVE